MYFAIWPTSTSSSPWWQAEVADVRLHGTVHERPVERFAREAAGLVRTLDQPSFYQAMPRERVVAED